MIVRQTRSFVERSTRQKSNSGARPKVSLNAQRSYERYLALACAEAQNGNTVGAENCYQYAEHYYRLMSSNGAELESKRRRTICFTMIGDSFANECARRCSLRGDVASAVVVGVATRRREHVHHGTEGHTCAECGTVAQALMSSRGAAGHVRPAFRALGRGSARTSRRRHRATADRDPVGHQHAGDGWAGAAARD